MDLRSNKDRTRRLAAIDKVDEIEEKDEIEENGPPARIEASFVRKRTERV